MILTCRQAISSLAFVAEGKGPKSTDLRKEASFQTMFAILAIRRGGAFPFSVLSAHICYDPQATATQSLVPRITGGT